MPCYDRKYYEENKEQKLEQCRKYREENREQVLERVRKYREENPDKIRAMNGWKNLKLRHPPGAIALLTKEHIKEIKRIYRECPEGYVIDHIIPIEGAQVSGLPYPWNLKPITLDENRAKDNHCDGTYDNESWRHDYQNGIVTKGPKRDPACSDDFGPLDVTIVNNNNPHISFITWPNGSTLALTLPDSNTSQGLIKTTIDTI